MFSFGVGFKNLGFSALREAKPETLKI